MAKQYNITLPDDVSKWLDKHAIEATVSDFLEHALIEKHGIEIPESKKRGQGIEAAKELIRMVMKERDNIEAKKVDEISELFGISKTTMRRARVVMKIPRPYKKGFGAKSKWYWGEDKG